MILLLFPWPKKSIHLVLQISNETLVLYLHRVLDLKLILQCAPPPPPRISDLPTTLKMLILFADSSHRYHWELHLLTKNGHIIYIFKLLKKLPNTFLNEWFLKKEPTYFQNSCIFPVDWAKLRSTIVVTLTKVARWSSMGSYRREIVFLSVLSQDIFKKIIQK